MRLAWQLNDALIIQGLVSFVVCCFMVWVYRRRADRDLQNAALVSLTFLATLYAFHYDRIIFGWVFVLLMRRDDNTPLDYFLMLLVWATPLMLYFTGVAHIACTAIPIALFCLRLLFGGDCRVATLWLARAGDAAKHSGDSAALTLLVGDDAQWLSSFGA